MNELKTLTFKDGDISLDVIIKDNTGWLSTKQIATLFGVSRSTITRHISATYINNVVNRESTCAMLCISGQFAVQQTTKERLIPFYNLDIIEKIGRRLGSEKGHVLRDFINKELFGTLEQDNLESIVYNNGTLSVDVTISPKEETVWLSQDQIAQLFNTTRQNVSMHIKNIIDDGELNMGSICKDFLRMGANNQKYQVTLFNLDLILAVGYRVKSDRAIQFRRWVSSVLKQYIINGYAINEDRLRNCSDRIIKLENIYDSIKKDVDFIKENAGFKKSIAFAEGQYFDTYLYIRNLIESSKKSVTIIDPYFDDDSLKYFKNLKPEIIKKVYLSHDDMVSKRVINFFKKQYGEVEIYNISKMHDRFIIIDDDRCYSIGTSLNKAGNSSFAIVEIENKDIINVLLEKTSKAEPLFR